LNSTPIGSSTADSQSLIEVRLVLAVWNSEKQMRMQDTERPHFMQSDTSDNDPTLNDFVVKLHLLQARRGCSPNVRFAHLERFFRRRWVIRGVTCYGDTIILHHQSVDIEFSVALFEQCEGKPGAS
jgi:hypothetical protein